MTTQMSIQEAIEVLTQCNLWRRDNSIPNSYEMPEPKKIGIAIDKAVEVMKWIIALNENMQRIKGKYDNSQE